MMNGCLIMWPLRQLANIWEYGSSVSNAATLPQTRHAEWIGAIHGVRRHREWPAQTKPREPNAR